MKIIIVPDVHGRTFWRKCMDLVNSVDKIIFLGDYLDPYSEEGIFFIDAIEQFNDIIHFKKDYPDKVILLIGNHDCHYIWKDFPNCSRRNYEHLDEMHKLYNDNINLFQLIYETDNYIFSHAGIYDYWMNLCKFSLDDLKDWNKIVSKNYSSLDYYSYFRGGYHLTGSCVWADIRESIKHKTYSDKKQIVGHTQLIEDPYISEKITCIDCRKCFILENDEIKEC